VLCLSGCRSVEALTSLTTVQALEKVSGYENELRVRAVYSVDRAWFVPGKGLVFYGYVMPGRFSGDPIFRNLHDEPPKERFVAGLSLTELESRHPWVHSQRFHRAKLDDVDCIEKNFGGVAVATAVTKVEGAENASLWQLTLEAQRIHVAAVDGKKLRDSVTLGPRGGSLWYALALPVTLVGDAVRLLVPDTEPTPDVCVLLERALFPKESEEEVLEARKGLPRPPVEESETAPVSAPPAAPE
jgi:hypothetical protein